MAKDKENKFLWTSGKFRRKCKELKKSENYLDYYSQFQKTKNIN